MCVVEIVKYTSHIKRYVREIVFGWLSIISSSVHRFLLLGVCVEVCVKGPGSILWAGSNEGFVFSLSPCPLVRKHFSCC